MASVSVDPANAAAPRLARRCAPGFRALVAALRAGWSVGALTVVGPDGSVHRLRGASPGGDGRLQVTDFRFVRRLLAHGDIGFAESFIAGEWDTPDLPELLAVLAANFDGIAAMIEGHPIARLVQSIAHRLNRNTRAGSRRNVQAHYDLGNDFYRAWLDEGLNYSSALFERPGEDLAKAQRNKHAALARAMDLQSGQSLLEIGCGWGGFAAFAARECGATVTAVTISPAQAEYARAHLEAEGLSERVKVELRDYRDVEGRFDRIASIEMFEAVGEAYWSTYFRRLHDLLVPGGQAGLQIITIDDALFEGYRRRPDFIQMHIFPGGMLPSEVRLHLETDRAGLSWTNVRRFGQDYAGTLAEWARRFRAAASDLAAQGFDARFERLWRYYFGYCEAGFRTGRTNVLQLGLARN